MHHSFIGSMWRDTMGLVTRKLSAHRLVSDMTHSYVCHDSFIRATWLIQTGVVAGKLSSHWVVLNYRSLLQNIVSFTWLFCKKCQNRLDSVTCVAWPIYLSEIIIHMCDIMHFISVTWLLALPGEWHDSFFCVTWLIRMCDMTHSYVWHDSFICVTWLIHMCEMIHSYVRHDSFICVTWLIHMRDVTRCVTWLIHMCDVSHSYVWHDSFVCVTWLIHTCDMTHSYVW